MISVTDQTSELYSNLPKQSQTLISFGSSWIGVTFIILAMYFVIKKNVSIKQNKLFKSNEMVDLSHKQTLYQTLTKCNNQLDQLQQNLLLSYSLYKQLLYLKTNAYHSTSLNSILSIVKKQSSKTFQEQSSFENNLLIIVRAEIKMQTKQLISIITVVIDVLESSNQRFFHNENSFKQQKSKHTKTYKVNQFIKYNIRMRKDIERHKQKQNELQSLLHQIQQQNQIDMHYIDLILLGIPLISDIKTFIIYFSNLIYPSNIHCRKHKKTTQQSHLTIRVQDIHSQIQQIINAQQNNPLKSPINSNQSQNQLKQNPLFTMEKVIDLFISNKKSSTFLQNLSQILESNPKVFYQKQIHQLQIFEEQIRILKQKVQEQSQESASKVTQSNQIQIYHPNNSSPSNIYDLSNSPHILLTQKQHHNQQQSKQHITFSYQNKLSFIKQLDRLMIRNRIKRQMQEIDKKMKQQQDHQNNLHQHEDQNNNTTVTLEKL